MSNFIHLHLHTHLSMMDGCMHHNVLFKKLSSYGMNKVAITNHGNIMDLPQAIMDAAKPAINKKTNKPEWNPIQVIPGCEFYMTWDKPCTEKTAENKETNHIVLLAMNDIGYQNLTILSSMSHIVGKYYKPRIDRNLLERHNEGIICLSACLAGYLARSLGKNGKTSESPEIQEAILWYKEVFGDRFYIELQRHINLPEQDLANTHLVSLARQHNIQMVATCDSHYAEKEHFDSWKSMMLLSTGFKFGHDASNDYYLKNEKEMLDLFSDIPEAVYNTKIIADRCLPIKIDCSIKYPPFNTGGISISDYILNECKKGLDQRISKGKIPPGLRQKYEERMNYELEILNKKNFSSYLLTVAEYTVWAKGQGILMSPGRGSGAGSLVCYLLYITEVDPLTDGWDLLFERFINPERDSFPDWKVLLNWR